MSKYFAGREKADGTYEYKDIIFRKFPQGHPHKHWQRVFWGEHEIGWIEYNVRSHGTWSVIIIKDLPDEPLDPEVRRKYRDLGTGFSRRYDAGVFLVKAVGIWKPLD